MRRILSILFKGFFFFVLTTFIFITVKCVLAYVRKEPLEFGNYQVVEVASNSMKPEYEKDDYVIIKKIKFNDLKVGDDIVYINHSYYDENGEHKAIFHRIIEIKLDEKGNNQYVVTKGIANQNADNQLIIEKDVLGKEIYKMSVSPVIAFAGLGITTILMLAITFRKRD